MMLKQIQDGFENEGLGDLAGRLALDRGDDDGAPALITSSVRDKYKKAVSAAFLPIFACRDGKDTWRPVSYAMDIERHIDWDELDLAPLFKLPITDYRPSGETFAVGLGKDGRATQRDVQRLGGAGNEVDPFYLARVLSDDLIPNPWVANNVTETVLDKLIAKHDLKKVAGSFVYIVEQAKQHIQAEKDRLAKTVFEQALTKDHIRFTILADKSGIDLFKPRQVRDTKRLTNHIGQPLQLSLFDNELENDYNDLERDVAWFLEEQSQLYFWWRNPPKSGYRLQGWKKNGIYADFIFATGHDGLDGFNAFVVETKGIHLKNEDTDYKKAVFSMADQKSKTMQIPPATFAQAVKQHPLKYSVVHSDEWKQEFRRMIMQGD